MSSSLFCSVVRHSLSKCLVVAKFIHLEKTVKLRFEVVPVLNLTPRHEGVWGGEDIAPRFLNLGVRRLVVSFTPRLIYSLY
jgi:hypothetical protein